LSISRWALPLGPCRWELSIRLQGGPAGRCAPLGARRALPLRYRRGDPGCARPPAGMTQPSAIRVGGTGQAAWSCAGGLRRTDRWNFTRSRAAARKHHLQWTA